MLVPSQGFLPSSEDWVELVDRPSSLSAWSVRCQRESQQSAVSSTQEVPKQMDSAQNHFLLSSSLFTQALPPSFPQGGAGGTTCCLAHHHLLHLLVAFLIVMSLIWGGGLTLSLRSHALHICFLLTTPNNWSRCGTYRPFPLWLVYPTPLFSFTYVFEMISLYKESHLWNFSPFPHHGPAINFATLPSWITWG